MKATLNTKKLIAQDRSVEWLCAWLMLAWAITLILPGDTLSVPAFRGFRHHGLTAPYWCAFFGVLGGGRLTALTINGRWPKTARIRQIGAFFGAFSWVQIALLLFIAHQPNAPWSPSFLICCVLAVFEFLTLRRAAFDGRYYHR